MHEHRGSDNNSDYPNLYRNSPVLQRFSPSGEQPEHRILANQL